MPDPSRHPARRLVPEPLRSAAFDPSVADLRHERVLRTAGSGSLILRAGAALRFHLAVIAAALECRRLAVHGELRRRLHEAARESPTMTILHDIRLAIRRLAREPLFLVVTTVTLALGIGANLTIVGLVNGLLLAPIDAPHPEALVRVSGMTGEEGSTVVSFPNYMDARDAAASLDLAAHAQTSATVGPVGARELRTVELVTGNYFSVLDLRPVAGRLLDASDDGAELAHPVVVVSDGYWRARLGGRTAAVGETLLVNGAPYQIVGIAPRGYHGTYNAHSVDLWVPLSMQQQARPRGLTLDRRGWGWLSMIGRVRHGAPLAEVEGELAQAAEAINRLTPGLKASQGLAFLVEPADAVAPADRRMMTPALTAIYAFTVLLFLVTCANVAGVMQTRVSARRRELAIRQSLGAARRRIVVEWLAECAVLGLLGGALGMAISRLITAFAGRLQLPPELVGNLRFTARFDGGFLIYALGLAALASLLFGLGPAWRAGARQPLSLLKDEGGAVVGGRTRARLRRGMVLVEVAVSFMLLLASGLLYTSLSRQLAFDPGFDTGSLGLITLQRQAMPPADARALVGRALDRLRAEPGVVDAAIAQNIPLSFGRDRMGVSIPGYEAPDGGSRAAIDFNLVSATYFRTMGMRFQAGTSWTPRDVASAIPLVVNETLARRFWPGQSALGQTIDVLDVGPGTVVGVVNDIAYYEVGAPPIPYIYAPAEARLPDGAVIHVRTSGDPSALLHRLEQDLADVDSRLTATSVTTFEELRRVPLFPSRMLAGAATAFGLLALALTAVGLYGLVSNAVGQRTREIGVRIALGAQPGTVVRGLLRETLVVVGLGLAAGLIGGYLTAGSLKTWLAGVGPLDPVVTIGVAGLLAGCAALAAWLPARRAAAIDPVRALRE
jgi:putative ABC transport system permease protein